MSGANEAERLARAGLCRVAPPGDPRVLAAVAARGAVATWERLRRGCPGRDPATDLDALGRLGGRFVCPGDPEWPVALDDLARADYPDPHAARTPYGLWLLGPLSLAGTTPRFETDSPLPEETPRFETDSPLPETACGPGVRAGAGVRGCPVAIVGTRAATAYGIHVATGLAAGLAERGEVVISGAAYGIDAAAHRGALAGGGVTIAVVAGGPDVCYPRGHAALLERIRSTGLIVAEVPPGCAPMRHRFLARNRIIAALATGTVLVEAGLRSGARNTVRHARCLGREVLVVPGPVTSATSLGCLAELRIAGARAVGTVDQVLEDLGPLGVFADLTGGESDARDQVEPAARRLLDAVPAFQPAGVARIAATCAMTVPEALAALGPLLAAGLVEQRPDGYRLARRDHGPARS